MSEDWAQKIAESIEDVKFNEKDKNNKDKLPFGYFYPPSDGKIYWICSYSKDNKIISSFFNDEYDKNDILHKHISELKNIDDAIKIKDDLINDKWLPLKTPTKYVICNGVKIEMNKKTKKILNKKMLDEVKKNPVYKTDLQ